MCARPGVAGAADQRHTRGEEDKRLDLNNSPMLKQLEEKCAKIFRPIAPYLLSSNVLLYYLLREQ